MDKKTYTFQVKGMHCAACVLLTEEELLKQPGVTQAKTNLSAETVEICGEFGDRPATDIAADLSKPLATHGYSLSSSINIETAEKTKYRDFKIALPVALAFIALFVLLQKLGIVNLITADRVSYGSAFGIGIVASLSSCMAMVGGLLLSMSATFTRGGQRTKPQILFHVGRIIAFFVLGGVIGAIGSSFSLGQNGLFGLSLIIGAVMIILGLNLLDIFPWTKRLLPTMPKFIARRALKATELNHTLTPALVGIATFFLPCGFTQSMQLYALTTGSFLTGGLTMLAFALGTLPVLGLISFGSFRIGQGAKAGIFFKAAGIIVMLFGLLNILNSLAVLGVLPPLLNI